MKDGVDNNDVLTSNIDACLPFLIDSLDEQELVRTIIVVTIQQIWHWQQERERSKATQSNPKLPRAKTSVT